MANPIATVRLKFPAKELVAAHPPILRHPNKRLVYDIACPPESVHQGHIEYSRWKSESLSKDHPVDLLRTALRMTHHEGFYDYVQAADATAAVEWHVNFADEDLFAYYGQRHLAQDELQVAEHPALGSVREALFDLGLEATTVDSEGIPTPVLITGAERRCHLSTHPSAKEGRPEGIYGRRFGEAEAETVRRAVKRVDPPTVSNIIAMAAPAYGYGAYTVDQVEYILLTAWTGFRAAVEESQGMKGPGAQVIVHTGFWGAGAFGGNRVMMVLLQAIAADLAGIDGILFHTDRGEYAGTLDYEAALQLVTEGLARESQTVGTGNLITNIIELGLRWGSSDGN